MKNNETFDPKMELLISDMLELLGEDPSREGLKDTPSRVAKTMSFLTSGYSHQLDEIVNGALFEHEGTGLITVRDVEFYSLCEHHLLPFFGYIHIGYIPNGKIIGLSKVARITNMFSRRLQVQERLTIQIAQALSDVTGTKSVAVVTEARHMCMMMRGVEKQKGQVLVNSFHGDFETEDRLRQKFIALVRPNSQ